MDVKTILAGGSVVPATLTTTDILPSFIVNVRATETQSIRVSATRTLSRPEYRELSPINNYEAISGIQFQGNPDLERTLIDNLDVKWEWYLAPGEVLSLGAFGKRFSNPVERVDVAVSGIRGGQQQTVVNAEGADNIGLEAEVRIGLGRISERLLPLAAFANVTAMRSSIRTGNAEFSASTNDDRAMTGQAPYVVNTGLTYANESGSASATVLFNVVGRRISAAGSMPLPDVYEESRGALDLSVRLPLQAGLSAKLDARNLLDAPYELTQGSVTRERYRAGRVVSLGLTWRR
jgi:TonB-dependent receptor